MYHHEPTKYLSISLLLPFYLITFLLPTHITSSHHIISFLLSTHITSSQHTKSSKVTSSSSSQNLQTFRLPQVIISSSFSHHHFLIIIKINTSTKTNSQVWVSADLFFEAFDLLNSILSYSTLLYSTLFYPTLFYSILSYSTLFYST